MRSLSAAATVAAAFSFVGEGSAANATSSDAQEIALLKQQLQDARRSRKVAEVAAAADIANVTEQLRLLNTVKAELMRTRPKLANAKQELAEATAQLQELKEGLGHHGSGPVAVWMISFPYQWIIALLTFLLGLLAALGPEELVASFHSVNGALATGLLVAGSCSLLASDFFGMGTSWLDANCALLNGSSSLVGYLLWALVTCWGLIRWRSKVPFVLFTTVEVLHVSAPENMPADCQRPLVANDHEAARA